MLSCNNFSQNVSVNTDISSNIELNDRLLHAIMQDVNLGLT